MACRYPNGRLVKGPFFNQHVETVPSTFQLLYITYRDFQFLPAKLDPKNGSLKVDSPCYSGCECQVDTEALRSLGCRFFFQELVEGGECESSRGEFHLYKLTGPTGRSCFFWTFQSLVATWMLTWLKTENEVGEGVTAVLRAPVPLRSPKNPGSVPPKQKSKGQQTEKTPPWNAWSMENWAQRTPLGTTNC